MDSESKSKENGTCRSCGKKGVKYRCPSCLRRTCRFAKIEDSRVYVPFLFHNMNFPSVTLPPLIEVHVVKQERFLEDTERIAYTAHSSQTNKARHFNRNATNLLKKSHTSGVKLKLMPVGMKKRMLNTSFYDNRAKRIMWRVKWIFAQSDAEYIDKRVSEKEVITDLLKKYLDPDKSDPVIRQRLKIYLQMDINKICVLFKKEYQPANQEQYYLLDTSQTLQQNLAEKTVIEFPSLHVILPEYMDSYPILNTCTQTSTPHSTVHDSSSVPG